MFKRKLGVDNTPLPPPNADAEDDRLKQKADHHESPVRDAQVPSK